MLERRIRALHEEMPGIVRAARRGVPRKRHRSAKKPGAPRRG